MNLNKEIEKNYQQWRAFSRGLSKDADELLHTTLEGILHNADRFSSFDADSFKSYVNRALYLSAISPRSKVNYKRAIIVSLDECRGCENVSDEVFMHYRLMNEQLDVIIGRLPEYDAIILRQFILNGNTYQDLHKGTGIPIRTLRHSIEKSKKAIRNAVISRSETQE